MAGNYFSSNLYATGLILALSVFVLFRDDSSFVSDVGKESFDSSFSFEMGEEYYLKSDSLIQGDISDAIKLPPITNAAHVYPYTATFVSLTCLITLIMFIICFGAQLGGE
mmetsp:Transcript_18848/g.31542  ORF Transcript_18848/g.31542 Transcript_18848/m.31542 type:complete len:110 (-) Transcript_18848:270-599(-)